MPRNKRLNDAESLELYKISLYNSLHQTEISSLMTSLGYGVDKIKEGKSLLEETDLKYNKNKDEDVDKLDAYIQFINKKEELEQRYSLDRKKAKVVFRKDPANAERLMVSGREPNTHAKWMDSCKTFYTIASTDESIKSKLAILMLNEAEIEAGLLLVDEVEALRAKYLKEKGESQLATQEKDLAFSVLDDWMSDFYAVARIALDDKPQLLESLGKVIKN